jgi:hypothetical protein
MSTPAGIIGALRELATAKQLERDELVDSSNAMSWSTCYGTASMPPW